MTSNFIVIAPILLPLLAAGIAMIAWGMVRFQRLISLLTVGFVLLLAAQQVSSRSDGSILVSATSGWAPPFGIAVVIDLFSAVMVLLAAITTFAILLYSRSTVNAEQKQFGYYPLVLTLLTGVNGAFTTGDLFNLFVWFEVMLMSSFCLMGLGGGRAQTEGALKYMVLNLVASVFFLTGLGLVYGSYGSLNFADLALIIRKDTGALPIVIAALLGLAFCMKAAAFPVFSWLPTSYHTPPIPISALFAGLLTKVGVYALLRVILLIFGTFPVIFDVLLGIAVATMFFGVIGAVAQNDSRRILSFHIVSQIGYMLLGLGLATPLGVAGAIFYVMHHIIVKANLFLVAGVAAKMRGSFSLARSGGLAHQAPWLAVLFLIPALSLAGIPPLSGFFAKLSLLRAAVAAEAWFALAVAALVGIFTLISMLKIWNEVFWKPAPSDARLYQLTSRELATTVAPISLLALLTLAVTFAAPSLWQASELIAQQLLHPETYIQAVLGRTE